jgi:rod shape determining protein RodA
MLQRFVEKLQRLDWLLLLSVLVLFAFGISAIYSVALSRDAGFELISRHLAAFVIGFAIFIFMTRSNYIQLRNYGRGMYILGILLMVGVLIFGTTLRGTTGWFIIGPFSFQPVEFMKIALIIELARYFGEHARRRFGWREILTSGILTLIPVGLIMLQPDLGSASLLIGIWVIFLFFAGLRFQHAFALLGSAIVIGVLSWSLILADYQKDRVQVFLDPQLDSLGIGYNIAQAQIAIGSGQWFGRGLGFGSQSQLKFLPEAQTDFVFAVIAEELGFVGVLLVLTAIAVLLWRILVIALRSRDSFSAFLAIGIFASFFVQFSVNIGVNLAILPATGVALPFVSYGGSSLLLSLLMVGIVQSIAVHQHPGDSMSGAWYT